MIKIITGFGGVGGSTIALSTLANLFNSNGLPTEIYALGNIWEGFSNCRSINFFTPRKEDRIIYHFIELDKRLSDIQVLSCHETKIFPITSKKLVYDSIHYVSNFQREWQKVDGVVIPNALRKFTKHSKDNIKVAGIIGSIDRNKRVELSIERALLDGFQDIRLYGAITDLEYFRKKVKPLLSKKVKHIGVAKNMDYVYSQISHVYHSPELETFNLIKHECELAGVSYNGLEGNDTQAEIWTDQRILEEWKKLLLY